MFLATWNHYPTKYKSTYNSKGMYFDIKQNAIKFIKRKYDLIMKERWAGGYVEDTETGEFVFTITTNGEEINGMSLFGDQPSDAQLMNDRYEGKLYNKWRSGYSYREIAEKENQDWTIVAEHILAYKARHKRDEPEVVAMKAELQRTYNIIESMETAQNDYFDEFNIDCQEVIDKSNMVKKYIETMPIDERNKTVLKNLINKIVETKIFNMQAKEVYLKMYFQRRKEELNPNGRKGANKGG